MKYFQSTGTRWESDGIRYWHWKSPFCAKKILRAFIYQSDFWIGDERSVQLFKLLLFSSFILSILFFVSFMFLCIDVESLTAAGIFIITYLTSFVLKVCPFIFYADHRSHVETSQILSRRHLELLVILPDILDLPLTAEFSITIYEKVLPTRFVMFLINIVK